MILAASGADDLELRLADECLDRLLTWFPGLADPSDVEVDAVTKGHREDELTAPAGAALGSVSFVLLATLRYLRERDAKLASARNQFVALYEIIDTISLEHDGRVRSGIAAAIGDPENAGFGIELRCPLDMRWVGLLSGLSLRDRVRILTEIVRVLGNIVRFSGLPDSICRDLIRGLREPVGLLRAAIRDARQNPSDEADSSRAAHADPCSSDLIHANSVGEEER